MEQDEHFNDNNNEILSEHFRLENNSVFTGGSIIESNDNYIRMPQTQPYRLQQPVRFYNASVPPNQFIHIPMNGQMHYNMQPQMSQQIQPQMQPQMQYCKPVSTLVMPIINNNSIQYQPSTCDTESTGDGSITPQASICSSNGSINMCTACQEQCIPIIHKNLKNSNKSLSNRYMDDNNSNLSEEHFHKSFILTIGTFTVMDFLDSQPIPVIVGVIGQLLMNHFHLYLNQLVLAPLNYQAFIQKQMLLMLGMVERGGDGR